jgi:hypothetical protein
MEVLVVDLAVWTSRGRYLCIRFLREYGYRDVDVAVHHTRELSFSSIYGILSSFYMCE